MSSSSESSGVSSASRSHRSPQPVSHSPSPIPPTDDSSTDTLIGHLLASKRSLNSVTHLHRASAIIAEARSTLESTAVASARSAFLQGSLKSQVQALEAVHRQLSSLAQQAHSDFATVLKDLDDGDGRLEAALNSLKTTKIEQAFRPDDDAQQTLLDFVDEKPVEEIREGLRASIDDMHAAIKVLDDENRTFEDNLLTIKDGLRTPNVTKADESLGSIGSRDPSLPTLLHGMEEHAREMAIGVESLVQHFDLCVTAIRHTEGGGAAAQNITGDLPEGLDMGQKDFELPTQPISAEEYTQMLNVIHTDAPEVEEVVTEIQDRISEMEIQLRQIIYWRDRTNQKSSSIHQSYHYLESLAKSLPHYTSRGIIFHNTWTDCHMKIEEGLGSLDELQDVYANFLTAYDGLILEVSRRKSINLQMNRIVREAQSQLEKLYEGDIAEREAFRQEQGDYLPSDIWPGLADSPARFVISKSEDSGRSIPELPRKVIEDAMKRLGGSQQIR